MAKPSRNFFVRSCSFTLLLSLGLFSAPAPRFNKHEKAYYADQSTVAFFRPGLVIAIGSAMVAEDGTINVSFLLTDPQGLPLDRMGVTTPGPVSLNFVAAYIS